MRVILKSAPRLSLKFRQRPSINAIKTSASSNRKQPPFLKCVHALHDFHVTPHHGSATHLASRRASPPSKEITLLSITWHLRGWGTNVSLEKSDSDGGLDLRT
jgi:hypothetical protein